MAEAFDQVREQLERQYLDITFDPESGLPKDELLAALELHRTENPDEPRIITRAWLFHLLCSKARIAPEPDDYFVGKLEHHGLLLALRDEWWRSEGEREFRDEPSGVPGAFSTQLDCSSHICPDWRNLLKHGIPGLRDQAATHSGTFYEAVTMVYDGIIILLRRFAAAQPGPVLTALSEGPPKTFHEALQLAYLYNELQELDGIEVRSMGRFDMLYNDFYVKDINTGRLTRDQAKELLKYFWIKFFAKTQGKRFGKPFLFGPDANELSFLAFEAYREMRIVDPKFHVRVSQHTPRKFLEQVAGCIQAGCSSVVLVNDEAQIEMLRRNGKSREDSQDYILIGCYEPAVMGKELNCSGASALNLAKAVEQVLAAEDYPSFDVLMDAIILTLDANFTVVADRIRRWERLWPRVNPSPLLSGTMDSCIERGIDISDAGARYNTSGCCCVGLANTVDSLMVIKHLVFEEQRCSLTELNAALKANWEGHEELRLLARNCIPKWGNDDDRIDPIAVRITDFLGERINSEPNARNGVFQAALYGIIVAATSFGEKTGALPDGRRAGEPLTMNTGAAVGMDKNGVTSLINSVTKIDLSRFPNGTVLDIMLHPSAVRGAEGIQTICSIIQSHFAQGGMAIQFNIFDAGLLREAQQNPAKYANLQVRVCGWSVRFVDLTPRDQELFIAKAEQL